MRRSRFSEEQVICILKEHEAGTAVAATQTSLVRRRNGFDRSALS